VLFSGNREGCELRTLFDVYNWPRVDKSRKKMVVIALVKEEKPLATVRKRLSGELLGLTCGCDLRKEGVTVNLSGRQSNNRRLSIPEARSQPPHCD
jgi:hypothetical protein